MMMRGIYVLLGAGVASLLTGAIAGFLWRIGNRVGSEEIWPLVGLAVPANLVVALVVYYLVRGAVALADAGLPFFLLVALVHVILTAWVSSSISGALGAGTAPNLGVHTFSWGMAYALSQGWHDVLQGTWLHDS